MKSKDSGILASVKLSIYGPFDRFNYGDLLFVKVIICSFQRIFPGRYEFDLYGTISFDLSGKGGQKGSGFKRMKFDLNKSGNGVVLVAGGESIGATWHGLYIFLNKFYTLLCSVKLIGKILRRLDIMKSIMNSRSDYAFLINRNDFKVPIKILYNSVGALYFNNLDKFTRHNLPNYFAVRDQLSFGNIVNFYQNVKLIPDSAIVISEFENDQYFTNSTFIRSSVMDVSKSDYILFQVSDNHAKGAIEGIYEQLRDIKIKMNFNIVLCPFSVLPGHSNDQPLEELVSLSNADFKYIESPTVDEITLLIKNAKYFVGSSLHGVIVSMSYCTPYIGIGNNHLKLKSYLNSWSISELSEVSDPSDFLKKLYKINLDEIITKLKINLVEQSAIYFNSIKAMHAIISE